MAKVQVETVYKTITPTMAQVFLEKNHPNNRTISESLVTRYAEEIKNTRWVVTHQGIAFSTDGYLIDGQHRCHAIIRANKPVTLAITTGLPPVAIEGIDLNRVRRTSDVLEIGAVLPEGVNAQVAAARATILYRLMEPSRANGTLTLREFDVVWNKYHADITWAGTHFNSGGGKSGALQRKVRSAPVMGSIIAAHHVAPTAIEAFAAKLDSGIGIARTDDPAASLRRYLDGVSSLHGEGRMGVTYASLRAAYAAVHGQSVSVYRTSLLTRGNAEFSKILKYFGCASEET
jgi:hypothetical protein